jgi:DNA-binding transcriptional LysR family regulator
VDVTHLRSLLEFAESGNITRVAERLNYAPSSIHAHLRAIETEVGIELTERAGRGIALTSAGRAFVPHARRIVDAVSAALTNAQANRRSALTIAAAQSIVAYALPRAAVSLAALDLTLTIRTLANCTDNLRGVVDGEHELGLTLERRETVERWRDGRVGHEILSDVPISIATAPSHPLAGEPDLEIAALRGETLIETEPGCTYREAFAELLETSGVTIAGRITCDDFTAIRALARAGIGLAVVPRFVLADDLRDGSVVELSLSPPGHYVAVATWRRERESEALRNVLDVLRATASSMAQRPPGSAVLERP